MSKGKRELTGEEKKLWRRVATGVKSRKKLPEAPDDLVVVSVQRKVAPRLMELSSAATARATPPAAPADRGAEKRVRRGKLEIGASLDLHGHTQDSARAALARFLFAAQARGDATVIVITGVGRAGQGVLRQRLPQWLNEKEIRGVVSGFAQAHRMHGGAGAYYVFLKRAPL